MLSCTTGESRSSLHCAGREGHRTTLHSIPCGAVCSARDRMPVLSAHLSRPATDRAGGDKRALLDSLLAGGSLTALILA